MSDDDKPSTPDVDLIPAKKQDGYAMLPTEYLRAFEQARAMMEETHQEMVDPSFPTKPVAEIQTDENKRPGFAIDVNSPGLQKSYPRYQSNVTNGWEDPQGQKKWTLEKAGVNVGTLLQRRDEAYAAERKKPAPEGESPNAHSKRMAALQEKFSTIQLEDMPIYLDNGKIHKHVTLLIDVEQLRALNTQSRDHLKALNITPQDIHISTTPEKIFNKQGELVNAAPYLGAMYAYGMPDSELRVDSKAGARVIVSLSPEALFNYSRRSIDFIIAHEAGHAAKRHLNGDISFFFNHPLTTNADDRHEERFADQFALKHTSLQSSIEATTHFFHLDGVANGVLQNDLSPQKYESHPGNTERLALLIAEDARINKERANLEHLAARIEIPKATPSAAPATGASPTKDGLGKSH